MEDGYEERKETLEGSLRTRREGERSSFAIKTTISPTIPE